jgi:hypothetical protein
MLPNISLFLVARCGLAKITRIFLATKKRNGRKFLVIFASPSLAAENKIMFSSIFGWPSKIMNFLVLALTRIPPHSLSLVRPISYTHAAAAQSVQAYTRPPPWPPPPATVYARPMTLAHPAAAIARPTPTFSPMPLQPGASPTPLGSWMQPDRLLCSLQIDVYIWFTRGKCPLWQRLICVINK